jgi:hypothetical protein
LAYFSDTEKKTVVRSRGEGKEEELTGRRSKGGGTRTLKAMDCMLIPQES